MSSTAFDDQFTDAPEPVRQPYDTVAILRRNIASLEVALNQQTERAEKAEAELTKLAQHKPVAWMREDGNLYLAWQKDLCLPEVRFSPLYAAPVPAPAAPAEWREVMAKLVGIVESSAKFHGCGDITKQARALLQSEVTK